jgi:cytochrome c
LARNTEVNLSLSLIQKLNSVMLQPTVAAAVLLSAILSGAAHAQSGNAKAGEAAFDVCGSCHTTEPDAGNEIGPNLFGVVGRKAGAVSDFTYSPALKASGIVWTDETLSQWLSDPAKTVPGTSMGFPGMTKEKVRDLIAYLKTLK